MIERLIEFMEYLQINLNQFTVATGLTHGLINQKIKDKKGFNTDSIEKILFAFPELNANWLFRGEGEMLNIGSEDSVFVFEKAEKTEPNFKIARKKNAEEKNYIEELERTIEDKDKVINQQLGVINQQFELIESQKSALAGINNMLSFLNNQKPQ